MGSIPLVGLDLQTPAPAPQSPIASMQQAATLQGQQTQNQLGQIGVEQGQQDLKDQQAMTQALKDWDGQSYEQLAKQVVQNGGSGKAALAVEQHGIQVKSAMMNLSTQQLANTATRHDLALGELAGADKVPDAQLPQYVMNSIQKLTSNGTLTPQEGQEFMGLTQLPPDQLRQQLMIHEASLRGEKAQIAAQQAQAETSAQNAKASQDRYKEVNGVLMDLQDPSGTPKPVNTTALQPQDWANLVDSVIPASKDRQLNFGTHAEVDFALKQGNIKAAQDAITAAQANTAAIDKEGFVQQAENTRQALNRQAMQGNELQKAGLNKLDQMFTDPQHGYSQFLAQTNATESAISQAKDGSELAASLAPLMTVLGVNSFAGIHRINPQEYQAAGPGVGSIYRQINTLLDKAGTGSLNPDTVKEMNGLLDSLKQQKHGSLVGAAQLVAKNGGLDPAKTSVLDKDGNVTTLDKLSGGAMAAPGSAAELLQKLNLPTPQ